MGKATGAFLVFGLTFLAVYSSWNKWRDEATARALADSLRSELELLKSEVSTLRSLSPEFLSQAKNATSSKHRRPRTLLGIFSDLKSIDEYHQRQRFRSLLEIHPHVCPIDTAYKLSSECEVVYSFVIGRDSDVRWTTRFEAPIDVDGQRKEALCSNHPEHADCRNLDMIVLNIRENEHQGKSQTWLMHGVNLAGTMDVDYIAKTTTDTLLYLDGLVEFTRYNLPPSPYNNNLMAGSFADKFWWSNETYNYGVDLWTWMKKKNSPDDEVRKWLRLEGPFITKYTAPLHLYPQRSFYLLSVDLCRAVVDESSSRPSYLEGVEDHDIGAAAMIGAKEPIKLVAIAKQEQFWFHDASAASSRAMDVRWQSEMARLRRLFRPVKGGGS